MKGISAVIATILLLLIVIAIVGFAFGFFQRIFITTTTTTEEQVGTTIGQLQQIVRLENAAGTTLTLRNSGTASLNISIISVYVGSIPSACSFGTVTSIPVGTVANCNLTAACTGAKVRVTTAGSEDSRTCT